MAHRQIRHGLFGAVGAIALSLAACSVAGAESVLPSGLPPGFQDLVDEVVERCGDGRIADLPMEGFSQPYDFNKDGVADYVVESTQFRCVPDHSLIWGCTAGTAYFIYLSQADGSFQRAYAASGHAMRLVDMFGDRRAMAVVIFHHGSYCGLAGVASCVGAVIWEPFSGAFVGTGHAAQP